MIFYQLPNLFLGHKLFLERSVIYLFNYSTITFFKVQFLLEDQALNFPDAMVAVSQQDGMPDLTANYLCISNSSIDFWRL